MPLPPPLRPLVRTRRFWTDALWETETADRGAGAYPALAECVLHLPVGAGYALTLELDRDLSRFSLGVTSPEGSAEIAWDDRAHWHPHVLRWHELEQFCRAQALLDPELVHPGPLLLLLSRFAPLCLEDDPGTVLPLLQAAWERVGAFSPGEIQGFLERLDARPAGFRWRLDEAWGVWVLEQDDDDAALQLYTLRQPEHAGFPFAALAEVVARSGSVLAAAVQDVGAELARAFQETGDPALGPALAAALRDAPEAASVAQALGDDPDVARCAWICEVLLGVEQGTIVREHLSEGCLELREQHALSLSLPLRDEERPLPGAVGKLLRDSLQRVLSDLRVGSADTLGASSSQAEDGTWVDTEESLSVVIKGDLDVGLRRIREALWWVRAPSTTSLGSLGGDEVLPLELARAPADPRCCLDLSSICAVPLGRDWGYRLDRTPLSESRREALRGVLRSVGASEPGDGWSSIPLTDGGELRVCLRRLDEDPDLSGATVELGRPSPQAAEVIWRLAEEGGLLLLPLMLATSRAAAEAVAEGWPRVQVVERPGELFAILERGPHAWWTAPRA
ncbi:MAG: hypothetical protein R3F62_07940 [Planctomycetota bacterium]